MLYMMICKQHRHEEERCWFYQERHFCHAHVRRADHTINGDNQIIRQRN